MKHLFRRPAAPCIRHLELFTSVAPLPYYGQERRTQRRRHNRLESLRRGVRANTSTNPKQIHLSGMLCFFTCQMCAELPWIGFSGSFPSANVGTLTKHLGSESPGMSHCVHGAGNNVAAISCCACISADALKFCTLQQHTWYDG